MQADFLSEASRNVDPIADLGVGIMSFIALSTAWMDWLDTAIKVVIGLLTIALLVLRVRAHWRKRNQ